MPTATLTDDGQVVIPAEIRARHGLTAGSQVQFVDDDGVIRLLVIRCVAPSDPAAGYGIVKVAPRCDGGSRSLSAFDPAGTPRKSIASTRRRA